MHGAQRVMVFCLMVAVLPVGLLMTCLFLRHRAFADVHYPVAESDILEMVNSVSSIFCEEHVLKMNTPFNAYQAKGKPEMSKTVKKHVRLRKSMSLPDDTLEYWGFFLPSSSTVLLTVCSRYDGSRILVVKGEKNLRNCGLLQPVQTSSHHHAEGQGNIVVQHDENAFTPEKTTQDANVNENAAVEETDEPKNATKSNNNSTSHHRSRRYLTRQLYKTSEDIDEDMLSLEERRRRLERTLNGGEGNGNLKNANERRKKRQVPAFKLDGGIAHGGNALNYSSDKINETSVSSFENSLLTCYDGQILLSESFNPSKQCNGTKFLETGSHMRTVHDVISDGYYYYIFYSENDYVLNDIHAIFDIHKPTYQFGNYSIGCINQTECRFPVKFWSEEIVMIEVPTRDGIENEHDDITILTSVCVPRSAVYSIFPILILICILTCAFI
uniref:Uncharacterized protein n=1 Tax=Lygus hesperus TaxID=30085 RepID=A0A0K8SLU4_LYGHE